MGHKGDMEHEYTLNHGFLPESIIEDMRNAYAKSLKFLETELKGIPEDEYTRNVNEFKKLILMTAGFTEEEINKGNLLDLDNSELAKKLEEKRVNAINNGNKQKVISVKEVREYISKGWEFVNTLPGNKDVIMRIPS